MSLVIPSREIGCGREQHFAITHGYSNIIKDTSTTAKLMNLTHAYSKYIEDAYTNSDNTGDDTDVPRVTSPSSLLGSADRYKAPRVGSCKAIQDSIVTLSITDASRSFVTFCIERGGTLIYTLSLLNVTLSITKDT